MAQTSNYELWKNGCIGVELFLMLNVEFNSTVIAHCSISTVAVEFIF